MEGYAVNFGSSSSPITFDVTGVVNNGTLSTTIFNHDNLYTRGFSLVGNPYPSPVDWDSPSGWTRINIDNALYYFEASIQPMNSEVLMLHTLMVFRAMAWQQT
jgi:hypothetical protein